MFTLLSVFIASSWLAGFHNWTPQSQALCAASVALGFAVFVAIAVPAIMETIEDRRNLV